LAAVLAKVIPVSEGWPRKKQQQEDLDELGIEETVAYHAKVGKWRRAVLETVKDEGFCTVMAVTHACHNVFEFSLAHFSQRQGERGVRRGRCPAEVAPSPQKFWGVLNHSS